MPSLFRDIQVAILLAAFGALLSVRLSSVRLESPHFLVVLDTFGLLVFRDSERVALPPTCGELIAEWVGRLSLQLGHAGRESKGVGREHAAPLLVSLIPRSLSST